MTQKHDLTEKEKALLDSLLSGVHAVSGKKRVSVAVKKNPLKPTPSPVPLAGTLDLHGLTLEAAHRELSVFINAHYQAASRQLLVVTGKSGALARDVPRWLTLTDFARMVSTVAEASPRQGGAGALTVKLKTKKQ